jgi:AcrR family transcriptional regulator
VASERSLIYASRVPPSSTVADVSVPSPSNLRHLRRAKALSSADRRVSIATATLALLLNNGANVTTREIAAASGVAEGTIFKVFDDKAAVLRAAIDLTLDTANAERALADIDRACPFETQLISAVEVIQRRMADVHQLVSALGAPTVFAGRKRSLPDLAGLVALFARASVPLRYAPDQAARLLPAFTLAFSHPVLYSDDPLLAAEIVSLFLDGARAPHACIAATTRDGQPC